MAVNCPRCHTEISRGKQCANCNFDVELYHKIKMISLRLYNKGLEQAKNRDLTGAISSLIKSIEFDKTNITSRNVLGLVYYEVGQVGQALKQWVISTGFQKEENVAKGYIDQIQNSGRKLEQLNDVVKMFNQGLEYASQGSEDMAVIQLKKAIDVNPNFVEAYSLLGLCYMMQNQSDKGIQYIQKALTIDVNHPKSIRYYKELHPNSVRPEIKEKPAQMIKSKEKKYSRSMQMQGKKHNAFSPMGEILGFLVGSVCTFAVLYILIIPARVDGFKTEIQKLTTTMKEYEGQLIRTNREHEDVQQSLHKENEQLINENEALKQSQAILERVQKVQQASILVQNNKWEDAAILLQNIEVSSLPVDSKSTYEALAQNVYAKVSEQYYKQGITAYNTKKYEEAIVLFEKSWMYEQQANYSDDALYWLGRSYEVREEFEKAKKTYELLLATHPASNQKYNARNRLTRLQ